MSARMITLAAVAAIALLTMTACTVTPPSGTAPSHAPSGSPSAQALPAPEGPPAREPARKFTYNLGGSLFDPLVDGGPRKGANGAVTVNADGELASYTVVAGDEFESLLDRFGIDAQVLISLNAVRRENSFYYYVGDVVNLDPHTIASVGTENGRVAQGDLPDPAPEQR